MRSSIERPLMEFKFRFTIRSTKCAVFDDFVGLRRSPRVCKSLKNLKAVVCHGRGIRRHAAKERLKGMTSKFGALQAPATKKI
jgi:hypothetical protein